MSTELIQYIISTEDLFKKQELQVIYDQVLILEKLHKALWKTKTQKTKESKKEEIKVAEWNLKMLMKYYMDKYKADEFLEGRYQLLKFIKLNKPYMSLESSSSSSEDSDDKGKEKDTDSTSSTEIFSD